jgi:hypothetical protein
LRRRWDDCVERGEGKRRRGGKSGVDCHWQRKGSPVCDCGVGLFLLALKTGGVLVGGKRGGKAGGG